MDEILKNLLSSELLSEDAKADISSKWTSLVNSHKAIIKEQVTFEVRNELAEQWQVERDAIVEKVDYFVAEVLLEELTELKGEISNFRDLEVEHAEKLVEAKHEMADQLAEELDELVDKIDAFLEIRLAEDIAELKEDLEVVAQNNFGRKIFEAFSSEFQNSHIDEGSIFSKLSATTSKLKDASKQVSRLEAENAKIVRESKMQQVLSNLQGKKREQMAFVLANVETQRLEEMYNHFIGRVLKEDLEQQPKSVVKQTLNESAPVVITGDSVKPGSQKTVVDKYAELRRLAGI